MAYTLTIRGLSSKEDARKIAEDFFGVMRWKHEAGCTTCWPQRDEHPLTITDSAADGKIIADIRADLARVTAERDDYRSRWEQTGCTRHDAMETAIKLNESCRQQLEATVQELGRLREALDFYACVDHYAGGCADDVVSTDRGAKARAALNGEGEG